MRHQQIRSPEDGGAAGAGIAAGGSCISRNENHVRDDCLDTVCDRRSSVSSITNDCAPISNDPRHGTGLVGYSNQGDEGYYRSCSTPLPGGAENAIICASYQANVQQTGSQKYDDERVSGKNGNFDHPNIITIPISNPSRSSTKTKKKTEGRRKDRRIPWYDISNQCHLKTHPIASPTSISNTPPMTPDRDSIGTNAQKQQQPAFDSLAVGDGRLVMASFEGGLSFNVDSDSLVGCTISTTSSTHSITGFGTFLYRKVKNSSRRNKLLFGLIAITTVTAFSAAIAGLLETTASHSDRMMTPTYLPENGFAKHSPSIGPTLAPSSLTARNRFSPSSSVVKSKNVTLLPTVMKLFLSTKIPSDVPVVSPHLIENIENRNSTRSREPINLPSLQPSTHRPMQKNTSYSPTIMYSATKRPTPHPTEMPSSPLPTSRPIPQPTRKPMFEPTLPSISVEPTADPSMRNPSPSPFYPPTILPSSIKTENPVPVTEIPTENPIKNDPISSSSPSASTISTSPFASSASPIISSMPTNSVTTILSTLPRNSTQGTT